MYIYFILCYKELDHKITKAKKSHNLLSASWRPRKSSGTVKFKGQKDQKEPMAESDVPAYIIRILPPPFGSLHFLKRLDDAHPHWGW